MLSGGLNLATPMVPALYGTITTAISNASAVAIAPDGRTLYVTDRLSASVIPVSLVSGSPTMTLETPVGVPPYPGGITIAPDGARAYVPNSNGWGVTILSLAAPTAPIVVVTTAGPSSPHGIVVTPDNATACVAGNNDMVYPYTLSTGPPYMTLLPTINFPAGVAPYGIALAG